MRERNRRDQRPMTCVWSRVLAAVAMAVLVGACAQGNALLTSESLAQKPAHPKILIMPPDVELSEVTIGGLLEPNAAWTETGRGNINTALDASLADRNATLVRYVEPASGTPQSEVESQLIKLHQRVGGTIVLHKYLPALALPTKKDKFDWSLGDGATALREPYGADYALFVHFRDSFSSGGRAAIMVAGALFGGGIVSGGTQSGFASLVDLRNGQIVWMNRFAIVVGDLRKPESAQDATNSLLSKLPL